jgi:UDP-N-acetylmuramate: L-alanyl-gamma-D-glutamyl-meso-diaminopimelate ligase
MKRLPMLSKEQVADAFNHPNMQVFTDSNALQAKLHSLNWNKKVLLMMSSGNFHGVEIKSFAIDLLREK